MPDCPVCTRDHPTGAFTQTFGGVRHRSRECAGVASRVGVNLFNIRNTRMQARLGAAKRRLEANGASWCDRCGSFAHPDEPDCQKAWQR